MFFKHLVFDISLNCPIVLAYHITVEKIRTPSSFPAFMLQLVELETELNPEILERSSLLAAIWWVSGARGMSGNHIGMLGG